MPVTPPLASRAAPRASVDLVRTVAPGLLGAEQCAHPSGNTRTCAVSLLDPAPRPAAWMPPSTPTLGQEPTIWMLELAAWMIPLDAWPGLNRPAEAAEPSTPTRQCSTPWRSVQ